MAKARLQRLRKYLPVSKNHLRDEIPKRMNWQESLEFSPVLTLSEDLTEAMQMMMDIDAICEKFPGLDCGACGAPSCRALAEDVVKGLARESDCVFVLREEIQQMADIFNNISGKNNP